MNKGKSFLNKRVAYYTAFNSKFKDNRNVSNGLNVFCELFLIRLSIYNIITNGRIRRNQVASTNGLIQLCEGFKSRNDFWHMFRDLHTDMKNWLLAPNPFNYKPTPCPVGVVKWADHWGLNGGIVPSIDLEGTADEGGHQDLIHDRGDPYEVEETEDESWETAEEGNSLEENARRAPVANHLGMVEFYQRSSDEERLLRQRTRRQARCAVF